MPPKSRRAVKELENENTTNSQKVVSVKGIEAEETEEDDDELSQAVRGKARGTVGRELIGLQATNRPPVILEGPRASRLRSSLSGNESSPAHKIPKRTNNVSMASKVKKPFEKLLANAVSTTSNTTTLTNNNKKSIKVEVPTAVVAASVPSTQQEVQQPLPKTTITANSSNNNSDNAYEELRLKFERLRTLKHSDAEELLAQYQKTHEARAKAAESLITALRAENAQLKQAVIVNNINHMDTTRRDSIASTISSTNSAITTSTVLEVYRLMAGLDVTPVSEEHWKCRVTGRKGGFDFELELVDPTQGILCYRPMFGREDEVCERLPSYLTEEIEFGVDQLQLFFWRAFNFLMSSSK